MIGWVSKLGGKGKAHYLDADGTTACSKIRRADGSPELAPFLCRWTERRLRDPLCTLCRRRHPTACHCGRCTVEEDRRIAALARAAVARAMR